MKSPPESSAFMISPDGREWFSVVQAANDYDCEAGGLRKGMVRTAGWIGSFLVIAGLSAATVHSVKVTRNSSERTRTSPRGLLDLTCEPVGHAAAQPPDG